MIEPGAHFQFVLWAYLGVAVVVLALVGWVVLRSVRARAALNELERQMANRDRTESGA